MMKQFFKLLVLVVMIVSLLLGCGATETTVANDKNAVGSTQQQEEPILPKEHALESENDREAIEHEKTVETNDTESVDDRKELTENKDEKKNTPANNQQIDPVNDDVTKQKSISTTTSESKEDKQSTNTEKAAPSNSSHAPAVAQKEDQAVASKKEVVNEVTLTIKGDDQTGTILHSTTVPYEPGDTVLDLLKKVTKTNRIQMEYRGSGGTAYIEGINNLYEFDKGPKSGWMYSINGVFMKKSAGLAEVKPGDQIEWMYTLELGKDLGANVNE